LEQFQALVPIDGFTEDFNPRMALQHGAQSNPHDIMVFYQYNCNIAHLSSATLIT
jgi:hypothetical protein